MYVPLEIIIHFTKRISYISPIMTEIRVPNFLRKVKTFILGIQRQSFVTLFFIRVSLTFKKHSSQVYHMYYNL